MSTKTGIEWTDATWNPIRGCSRVDEGCRNCYAERVAARFSGKGQPYQGLAQMTKAGPRWTGALHFADDHLYDPLRWQKPRTIFVNSMSDLFHEDMPEDIIAWVFAVMAWSQKHKFQVLTKRAERMAKLTNDQEFIDLVDTHISMMLEDEECPVAHGFDVFNRTRTDTRATAPHVNDENWPLPNVWLGTSVSDQPSAEKRMGPLCLSKAAVRFVSYEPALGPVDFSKWIIKRRWTANREQSFQWLICGGESGIGEGIRPMHPDWARSARDQCAAAGIPFFFKQWGEWGPLPEQGPMELLYKPRMWPGDQKTEVARIGKKRAGRLLDGREHNDMPGVEIVDWKTDGHANFTGIKG